MIEVQHLSKQYGNHMAVEDLTFTIEPGHIYGFLGPNGAGKSTTMNMITGCLAATGGSVRINGHDIYEEPIAAKRSIGYLPEQPPLYPDMTPLEYLEFVAHAKGVPMAEQQAQVQQVMALTSIQDKQHRLIRHLSKGYRQRVGLAQALLGDPAVVILDEPTVGLDPLQIIEVRDLIRKLGQTHTVILSSHILSEVQSVCDRVMIIAHGRLVASGTPQELEAGFRGGAVIALTVRATQEQAEEVLQQIPGVVQIQCAAAQDGLVDVDVHSEGEEDLREQIFFAFAEQRLPIVQMSREQSSLEDIFLQLTREEEPAAAQAAQEEEDQ